MKKFLSLIIALVLTMSAFAVFPVFAADTVYDVGTADELDDAIAAANQMADSSSVIINLTADIVYNEGWTSEELFAYATTGENPSSKTSAPATFTPLGSVIDSSNGVTPFMGTFNGNGYTISGLCVRRVKTEVLTQGKDEQGAALIAFGKGATVNNVTIDRAAFFANGGCVGAIIGNSYQGANTVSGINVSDVQLKNAASYTGGIIGVNYVAGTSISNVNIDASVSGTGSVGGVLGYTQANTSISNVTADVIVNGTSTAVGGIVGYNKTNTLTVNNVYVEGTVASTYESSAKVYVGGVCGQNDSSGTLNLTNAVVAVDVTGKGYVGSALGVGTGGGVSNIKNCFASGDVTATSQKAGGIVGCVNSAGATTLKNCVYTGTVEAPKEYSNVFGYNHNTSVTATACYGFKKDNTSASTAKLYGGCSSDAVTVANSNVECKTRDELAAIIDGWGEAATDTFENSTDALGALFNNTVVGIQTGYDKTVTSLGRTRAVRFIATIDATDYQEVGFIIKMTRSNGNGGTESATVERSTKYVYTAINSVSESTLASEYGSKYLTAIGVNQLDSVSELTFEVKSYVITLDGDKYITDVKTVEYENKNGVIYINGKEEK